MDLWRLSGCEEQNLEKETFFNLVSTSPPPIFKLNRITKGRCQKKNIKGRDFSLSRGGGQPHSLPFFLSFFDKLKQHF